MMYLIVPFCVTFLVADLRVLFGTKRTQAEFNYAMDAIFYSFVASVLTSATLWLTRGS